jgi:hypothetical protein
VIRRVEHVARWVRTLTLVNPASRLNASEVTLELYDGKEDRRIEGTDVELRYTRNMADELASPRFRVRLRNNGTQTLYCGLLGLSQLYGVENLFPQGTLRLEAGQEAWVNGGKPIVAKIPPRLLEESSLLPPPPNSTSGCSRSQTLIRHTRAR